MSDSEVSNTFEALLEKFPNGVEVIVDQNHRPVALISSLSPRGRLLPWRRHAVRP